MISNKFLYNNIISIITVLVISFILYFSIEEIGGNENIWIEAEDAIKIEKGLEIFESDEASNGKAIVSRLQSHLIGSFASYEFNIINNGNFHLWARTFWPGACNNSFKISLDKSNTYIIGNDNFLNNWHWVQKGKFELMKGKHDITIYNEEYDARLDKILLTSNPYYIPSGFGISSDFDINFENGFPDFMISNMKTSCKILKENSDHIMHISPISGSNTCNLLFDKINKDKFIFELVLKGGRSLENHEFEILFNYSDDHNYNLIKIRSHNIELSRVSNGVNEILANRHSDASCLDTTYQAYTILYSFPEMKLLIDGRPVLNHLFDISNVGKIGLKTKYGDLYINNVVNTSILYPSYSENFFLMDMHELLYANKSSILWKQISEEWKLDRYKMIQSLEGLTSTEKPAKIIFGKDYWHNYSFETAIKLVSNEAGLFFNYKDSSNFYLLRLNGEKNRVSLLKSCKGYITILDDINKNLNYNEWYKVNAAKYKDSIYISIDDQNMIQEYDSSFYEGKTGLWSTAHNDANLFDDIMVSDFNPHKKTIINNIYEYIFEIRDIAGKDFSDWENSGNVFKEKVIQYNSEYVYMDKGLIDPIFIKNKKSFNGNFKVILQSSTLPVDVNYVCRFDTKSTNSNNHYEIIFTKNKILFKRDEKIIEVKEIENYRRNYFEIEYNNKKWHFTVGENISFDFIDDILLDSSKISVGFTGIGKSEIYIQQIMIEDNINPI